MATCQKCGQELFGAIECFKCGFRADPRSAGDQYTARVWAKAEEEDQRKRKTFWYRFWFRLTYGELERRFLEGTAELHDMERVGSKNFACGNILFHGEILKSVSVRRGAEAWEAVEQLPDLVSTSLTCSSCRFKHVIREAPFPGQKVAMGPPIPVGRFDNDYLGLWESSWFRLVRPVVARSMGIDNSLVCQKCGGEGSPRR